MKAASTPFKKKKKQSGVWLTLLPLYLFTLVFVAGPLVYMFVLSFQTRAEVWGVVNQFTLDNYKNIFQPVYLNTFVESFKLALTSTLLICAIGYPFGYFMAKLPAQWKKRVMLLLMIPFWTSSLIRLYGWIIIFRANGTLDKLLMGLGLTDSPLKLLYTYNDVQGQQGANAESIRRDIAGILHTLNQAFDNLYDNLLSDMAMDVSSEIAALQGMLANDGLTGRDFQ